MNDFRVDLMNFPHIAALLSHKLPMAVVMRNIGEELKYQIDKRFEGEHGPGGEKWVPSYRVKMGAGGKGTLEHHGDYRNSYDYEASANETVLGSGYKWANTHHYGATIKPKDAPYLRFKMPNNNWVRKKSVTIPARPVLGFDDQSERLVKGAVEDVMAAYWSGAI